MCWVFWSSQHSCGVGADTILAFLMRKTRNTERLSIAQGFSLVCPGARVPQSIGLPCSAGLCGWSCTRRFRRQSCPQPYYRRGLRHREGRVQAPHSARALTGFWGWGTLDQRDSEAWVDGIWEKGKVPMWLQSSRLLIRTAGLVRHIWFC